MDTVAQPHHPHRLLQPHLLLVHDRLDDHGGGVDPGEGHEEGEGSGDGDDEPVLDVAGVGHLLQGHSWQGADVSPCVLGDDGVLHHVLKVSKTVVEVLQIYPRSSSRSSATQPILVSLRAVHLVRINADLVGDKLWKLLLTWSEPDKNQPSPQLVGLQELEPPLAEKLLRVDGLELLQLEAVEVGRDVRRHLQHAVPARRPDIAVIGRKEWRQLFPQTVDIFVSDVATNEDGRDGVVCAVRRHKGVEEVLYFPIEYEASHLL